MISGPDPSRSAGEPPHEPAGAEPPGASQSLADRLEAFRVPPGLLRQAMAHRSYCAEHPEQASNERLELLGDAVLGLVVTDHLYRSFPSLPEGDLARVRAAVVSGLGLGPIAASLGLGEAILLGRGEEVSGGRSKSSILVDALEAVIGAVYLSAGFPGAQLLVESLLGPTIAAVANEARLGDPKNRLQELCARFGWEAPTYLVSERGPDHAKQFEATAVVSGRELGIGAGRSKKVAEREAARGALLALAAADGTVEGVPAPGDARPARG